MLNSELKSKISKLWDKFWAGGITNPLTAIEQISYLIFMKKLEDLDRQHENEAIAILRMLDCGSNNAFVEIDKKIQDTGRSVKITKEIIMLDSAEAKEKLESQGFSKI